MTLLPMQIGRETSIASLHQCQQSLVVIDDFSAGAEKIGRMRCFTTSACPMGLARPFTGIG